MDTHEIKKILLDHLSLKEIYVSKDGSGHYQIVAVSDYFLNMNTLQRQKIIYTSLMEYILDGRIHSLSIQVFTLKEWEYECECIVQ